MTRLILPAILLLPLVEIAGFVWIGGWLGIWGTLLWTLMAALIGLRLLSRESVGALRKAEEALRGGRSPAVNAADAALAALAGFMLLIPGFFTDAVGLALALRPVRLWIAARAAGRFGLARAKRSRPGTVELEMGEYRDVSRDPVRRPPAREAGVEDAVVEDVDPRDPSAGPKDTPWRGPR
ncbi:MAG: FxsA family protein [Pseudomonadota bacterium]